MSTDTASTPAADGAPVAARPVMAADSAAARRGGPLRRVAASSIRGLKDWLDRPTTSWHLVLAIFSLLLGFGLLMVLSASSITEILDGSSPFAIFENQAIFAVIGLAGFVFASRFAIGGLHRLAFPAVITAVGLLAAVLVIGHRVHGARSWLGFGSFSFQPSEVAKLALLLWMAHVLTARRHQLRSPRALLFPVLPMFVLMVALIMLEPDLGTTVSLGIVFLAVLWFAGAPIVLFVVALLAAIGGGAVLAVSAPYRFARVLAFLHPGTASAADTYQVSQGFYALGHGGIFGAGLGNSLAKRARLPNADSDFIFAVIGEELGLIGTVLVLLLFALLAYTGLRIARRNADPFIKVMASACTVWLVGQAAINVGYVVGLLPVTGIPLPMISAGGTSLVVTMTVFGLLANFARREPQAIAALHLKGPGWFSRFLGVDLRTANPAETGRVKKARKAKKVKARPQQSSRPRMPDGRPRPSRQAERPSRRTNQPPVIVRQGPMRGRPPELRSGTAWHGEAEPRTRAGAAWHDEAEPRTRAGSAWQGNAEPRTRAGRPIDL